MTNTAPSLACDSVRLAEGLQLLGQYQGSGTAEEQYLLRRRDGQVLVVSRLVYAVVAAAEGEVDLDLVAARATAFVDRTVSPGNVAYLVERKLRPLGIVGDTADAPPPSTRPVLALGLRRAIVPVRVAEGLARRLLPLFLPAVVIAVLLGFVAMDSWLLLAQPITIGVGDILRRPADALLLAAITVLAGGFHEIGHATGGLYGGARPGRIGVGLYLIWPAFFSDLTDSYRLSRAGRLRADLGGVYFNVVFMLVLFELYWATGSQALLLAVAFQHLLVLQQFLPFIRLDGYYIVSDLVGVPDLFSYVRPILAGALPRRQMDPRVVALRPKIRVLVALWVFLTVVLMSASLVFVGIRLPHFVAVTRRFGAMQATAAVVLARRGNLLGAAWAALTLLPLVLAVTGLFATSERVLGRRRHPRSRGAAA